MLSDKIQYCHESPDGIKSVYRITYNDLLSEEFLLSTSLSDSSNFELFNSNLNKRIDKIREVAKNLNSEVDFTKIYFFFEVESYNLEKLVINFLPHLI